MQFNILPPETPAGVFTPCECHSSLAPPLSLSYTVLVDSGISFSQIATFLIACFNFTFSFLPSFSALSPGGGYGKKLTQFIKNPN